jgi:alpha-mannosidase
VTTPEQAAVDSGLYPADTPRVGGETPEQIAVDAAQEPRESASGNEVAGETGASGANGRAPVANGKAPVANAPAGTQPRDLPPAKRPTATPQRTLHMIGNAHLDPVWLWPWQEGYQEARATFWSAIQRMEEYPDFVFTCDQIVLLSWVEESDPELFEQIKRRVAEGRWVNVGGWWVEPDNNMPMGESFVRQGLYGQRYLESRFGKPSTVGMNVDPFGHNAMLPQILRGQGMDSYTFLRPGPHESDLAPSLFWWEAPDGAFDTGAAASVLG